MKRFIYFFNLLFVFVSCTPSSTPTPAPTINPSPTPTPTFGTVSDADGNTYTTIVIGTQTWLSENLRTTKYCNGDLIPNITDNTQWNNLISGAWNYYNNDSQYNQVYGKLYNWYTVDDSRNLCPCAWHVPSDNEWTTLINYLGGDSLAYLAMKSIGSVPSGNGLWFSNNTANNSSGFNALPAGQGGGSNFYLITESGQWWAKEQTGTGTAHNRYIHHSVLQVKEGTGVKKGGMSVRCIKD
jgi:uncharacterized protein (TIGR02145 family)